MVRSEMEGGRGIGAQLRAARKSMGLRQGDLAAMAGLPPSHLSDIEREAITPTIPTLRKLGKALHRPLEYFLQEDNQWPRSLGMVIQEVSIGGKAAGKFAELVEAKTQGSFKLRLYQFSTLGTARQQVEALPEGAIHLYLDEPLSFECFAKLCGIVFQPFFFQNREHYHRFLRSDIFEEHIHRKLLASGIRLLNPVSNWVCGSFEILFSREPVFTPTDLIGKRFRSYPSEVSVDLRRALKTSPVVVEWMNVYKAFEKSQIDIFLVPAAYFLATGIHELARYATVIDYGYTLNLTIAVGEREYRKLSPIVQETLVQAVEEAGVYCTQLAKEQTLADLRLLQEEYGIPVIYPDPETWRSQFSAALREECCGKRVPVELYDAIQTL